MTTVAPKDPSDRLGTSGAPWASVHAQTLFAGGTETAKVTRPLDQFGAPGDTTDLDATVNRHGLMPKLDKQKLDGIAAGANAYAHPNHTGDVTSAGDGATTISNNAVDNAKLADMASGTIKGRATAGAGDPEDLDASAARALIGLGTAATTDASAYATAAQGSLADSAVQPGGLATVATSGAYADLSGKPTVPADFLALADTPAAYTGEGGKVVAVKSDASGLEFVAGGGGGAPDAHASTHATAGSDPIAPSDIGAATAAQGSLADSAVQPGDLATVATSGDYADLSGKPLLGSAAGLDLGTGPGTVAAGDDSRLSDSRAPTAHAASHVGAGGDKIRDATASQDGLMTAAFAAKLDGIAEGANAYVLPSPTTTALGGVKRNTGSAGQFVSGVSETGDLQYASPAGGGDMLAATYDPTAKAADAFSMANMAEAAEAKILTAAERDKLADIAPGANAYAHPNHTGDVTSAGDGATTISNNAVDNANLADMASGTIKGRATAGTGDPEDLDASAARTLLGLGTAATTDASAYATAAQGSLADSAVQPGDLATVATSGSYADLSNQPSLVTAFTGLTDTPSAYTGEGGKVVAVKSDASGLEFVAGGGGGGEWVALGRFTATDAADLRCDGIFDNSLYSVYVFSGFLRPSTNNVSMDFRLRNDTPADISGGIRWGGLISRIDAGGGGAQSTQINPPFAGLGNASGRGANIAKLLVVPVGNDMLNAWHLLATQVNHDGAKYRIDYGGEFGSTDNPHGLRFFPSAGNLNGWIEVVARKAQS
jgi:hypothetical protein